MSLGHGASIVRDGLVLHLDAANVKSYPSSGTAWNDLSGNGYDSILANTPSYSTSNSGYFYFDGTNEYVQTPYNITNKINVTFQAWVNISNYPPSGKSDIIFDQSTGAVGCLFIITSTGLLQAVAFNSSGVGLGNLSSLVLPPNQWKFLSVSIENNKINYYMDLENSFVIPSAGTINIIKADNTNTLRIGTTVDGNTAYNNFNGLMSNVMIYEKVLTYTEVKQNFEALRGRYGI